MPPSEAWNAGVPSADDHVGARVLCGRPVAGRNKSGWTDSLHTASSTQRLAVAKSGALERACAVCQA
ncbi:hypothetical protein DX980_20465 (plasmid) [Burkholderia gladioli]|nr:hypothetical protein DX980_20465 [Burkholderia gladioli]